MSKARITTPGITDNEWMLVLCYPALTSVDFFETEDQALADLKRSLKKGVSGYVGHITKQGEFR